MAEKAMRYWCARCQYGEQKPFLFGNAQVRPEATMQEVEEAVRAAILEIFPTLPDKVHPIPGTLFFQPE